MRVPAWCDLQVQMIDRPRRSGLLAVDDGHRVYWEEWGDPDGVPALHVHGGPGGGLGTSGYRQRFDQDITRVVGFEQRGCGRSTPSAGETGVSLADNDTSRLIDDMEALRLHLDIDAWILNGVSWGSTLALAYAQAHPEQVLGIVLYAVTTTSRAEVDWITEGIGTVFPEAWDRFAGHAEQAGIGYRRGEGRLVEAYAGLLASRDQLVQDAASREWALWEDTHVSIGAGGFRRHLRWEDGRFRRTFARLTTHYWSHDGFCDPPLLQGMSRLEGIRGTLIHGRRDISSPAATAWQLHRAWPGSDLVIDEGDGHGGLSMTARCLAANTELARAQRGRRGRSGS